MNLSAFLLFNNFLCILDAFSLVSFLHRFCGWTCECDDCLLHGRGLQFAIESVGYRALFQDTRTEMFVSQ